MGGQVTASTLDGGVPISLDKWDKAQRQAARPLTGYKEWDLGGKPVECLSCGDRHVRDARPASAPDAGGVMHTECPECGAGRLSGWRQGQHKKALAIS